MAKKFPLLYPITDDYAKFCRNNGYKVRRMRMPNDEIWLAAEVQQTELAEFQKKLLAESKRQMAELEARMHELSQKAGLDQ